MKRRPPSPILASRDLSGTSPHSPDAAREFARETLREWGLPQHADTAQLVVSELTTNAVQHGGNGTMSLVLYLPAPMRLLKIAVTDRGRAGGVLRPPVPAPDAESGRGLLMVEALSVLLRTKHTADPATTTVWTLLRL
ncbi:ATP-binding protein [Streptomyces parvus]|uniref:ATP-binding protein n=1 Tax=Streptomyces parvus TaxID=66428 RepID=UPI0036C8CE03